MVELNHKILGTVGAPTEKKEKVEKRTDLQSLIELGCVKDSVEIDSFRFTLRSLSATERFELSKEFNKENLSDDQQFDFNIRILATAIESVNGIPLEDLHPNKEGDVLSSKVQIISSLQTPVIAKLLDFYTSIMKRCDNQFDIGQIKN